jgi:hypothetical protein
MSEVDPSQNEIDRLTLELNGLIDRIAEHNPSDVTTTPEGSRVRFYPPIGDPYLRREGSITRRPGSLSVREEFTDIVGSSTISELHISAGTVTYRGEEFEPELDDRQEPPVERPATADDISSVLDSLKKSRQFIVPEISAFRMVFKRLFS